MWRCRWAGLLPWPPDLHSRLSLPPPPESPVPPLWEVKSGIVPPQKEVKEEVDEVPMVMRRPRRHHLLLGRRPTTWWA